MKNLSFMMINLVLKMMNLVFKMMNFALKLMNFAEIRRGEEPGRAGERHPGSHKQLERDDRAAA